MYIAPGVLGIRVPPLTVCSMNPLVPGKRWPKNNIIIPLVRDGLVHFLPTFTIVDHDVVEVVEIMDGLHLGALQLLVELFFGRTSCCRFTSLTTTAKSFSRCVPQPCGSCPCALSRHCKQTTLCWNVVLTRSSLPRVHAVRTAEF